MAPDAELIEMVFDHVCEHLPESVAELKDDEILRRAEVAVERAKRHGFLKESSVAAFASLMFLVAPNFDEQPNIKAALKAPGLPADACMERLMGNTKEEDWEAAGAQSANWP
jgi:hypothetical protein